MDIRKFNARGSGGVDGVGGVEGVGGGGKSWPDGATWQTLPFYNLLLVPSGHSMKPLFCDINYKKHPVS